MHNYLNKSIEEYTKELLKLYERNEAVPTMAPVQDTTTPTQDVPMQDVPAQDVPMQEIPIETSEQDNANNFSLFKAQIFSANQAFPVAGAKIRITRNNELIAFLITEADGQTKEITIPSPPEQNSLDPYSDNQSIDYNAEVYADGFEPKTDLLVSAVGDTFAILQSNITPKAEGGAD